MTRIHRDLQQLSGADLLARQFLASDYASNTYADWTLERRLDGYLRRRGMAYAADDGDICNVLLSHLMAISVVKPE